MKQYEYKYVNCGNSDYMIKKCLNENGKDGWELCASCSHGFIMLFFKREKKDA